MDPGTYANAAATSEAWRRGNKAWVNRAAGYASLNRVDCLQGAPGAEDNNRGRKG
jgi:hypothetical protein